MSNETPATHLARIKVQHPNWRITSGFEGGYLAVIPEKSKRIWAATLGQLEAKLNETDSPRNHTQS